jgi:hypothetical protein
VFRATTNTPLPFWTTSNPARQDAGCGVARWHDANISPLRSPSGAAVGSNSIGVPVKSYVIQLQSYSIRWQQNWSGSERNPPWPALRYH